MNAGPVALGKNEGVYQTLSAQLLVANQYQHTCVSSFAVKGEIYTLFMLAFISEEGRAFVHVICSLKVRGPDKYSIITLPTESSLSEFFMFSWGYASKCSVFISIFKFLLVGLI